MNVAQETWGFRRGSFSLPLSLLMSAFALPIPPARVTPHLRRPTERSPTTRGQKTGDWPRGQKTEDWGQINDAATPHIKVCLPSSVFRLLESVFCILFS